MPSQSASDRSDFSLIRILLTVLMFVLLVGGGASRADAWGQTVVRIAAWAVLVIVLLVGDLASAAQRRPLRPVAYFLAATIALAVIQLVPLPPAFWQALPGRALLVEAANASGQSQPWRPISMVPGATVNALSSLVVPAAMLALLGNLGERDRRRLPGLLVALIGGSMMAGLLQASGVLIDNPLLNDTPGEVSGTFANRNHFALFLALGCLFTPVWAFTGGFEPRWRSLVALALVPLLVLTILATGSRAGLAAGVLGVPIGLLLVRQEVAQSLRQYPKWLPTALLGLLSLIIAAIVLVTVAADRAAAIHRILTVDAQQDLRRQALPTIMTMIQTYFPAGTGLGSFDPVFRVHEPYDMLKLTYLNNAHNDFLEIVLTAGAPGLMLLVIALIWWARASARAWRRSPGTDATLPRLGSGLLLLIFAASLFDYPARTPMIMAIIVISATWLSSSLVGHDGSPLPRVDRSV